MCLYYRHYGLGFAVAEYVADNILRYWSMSDRIAVLHLRISSNSMLKLVNIYAPHSGLSAKDIAIEDDFFCDLANDITTNSSSALLYIAGDFLTRNLGCVNRRIHSWADTPEGTKT